AHIWRRTALSRVASAHDPAFRHRFVDRALALAHYHGLEALIAITKCDLRPEAAQTEVARYRAIGYETLALREDAPEYDEPLLARLERTRAVLVGQSGVGKSTLLNRLVGEELQKTGTISARYHRGRHTTNAAVLIQQGELEIVDTPGIRELDCRHIPADELDFHFIDLAVHASECRLTDCRHVDEPDCAVREAVEAGRLDSERHESYLRLLEEIVELQEDHQ
ncbi:MAG: ribosome small subunit-dependent GTPase A, partial [Spirochaetota bacterium]